MKTFFVEFQFRTAFKKCSRLSIILELIYKVMNTLLDYISENYTLFVFKID